MSCVTSRLLERDEELRVLDFALDRAGTGEGAVMLLSGEAGIGKTALVRAFCSKAVGRAQLQVGGCDDLLTPRTLGPLRDAVRVGGGPLAEALGAGDPESIFSAVLAQLSARAPTVLVVEDVHWADEATLDVLRFAGRRIADLPAVLLVTYRDDEVERAHRLQQLLGGLSGPAVRRLALRRLSRTAVTRLAGGTNATSAALFRLTGGNPFFVTEALAAPRDDVPLTVVDAVLARVRRLDTTSAAALDQLSVVPSGVSIALARELLGDLSTVEVAEQMGMLEVRPDAIAFRHELARRAVEGSLPVVARLGLNARVLAALLATQDPDPSRVIHHAVEAGDDAAVVAHAPSAAAMANRAGAHAQEVEFYEHALRRRHLLAARDQAAVLQACALALFVLNRPAAALEAGTAAVRLREELGEPGPLGEALVALAPIQWALTRPQECLATAARAVGLLEPDGDSARRVWALAYHGLLLTTVDRWSEALPLGEAAVEMAQRLGADAPLGLARVLRGRARLRLGDEAGLDEMLSGVRTAAAARLHQHVMMGYVCIVQELWQLGRIAEAEHHLDDGGAYAHERDVDLYLDYLVAHRLRLREMRGEWDAAEAGFRALLDSHVDGPDEDAGGARHSLPALARLLVRRGDHGAEEMLARAQAYAARANSLYELVPALMAAIEHAWLTNQPDRAAAVVTTLLARTEGVGRERQRGELLRYLRRLSVPVEPFTGCPQEYAAGIQGDWRAAAAAWERIGDAYQRALELAESDEPEPTVQALLLLEALGARPAITLVRQRLRRLGVTQIPRGPNPATRANPAGLTDRQVEIVVLLTAGLTNAEIAARLVVSIRTVDHHVSAVLQKLGVHTRRDVASAAVALGLAR
jgi:DNA-binding CsgD family transcriptional regulator/tetratricopeptide (TPR) repeat protein